MDARLKNSTRVAAIISGLMSLSMPWMTIHNAQLRFGDGQGDVFSSAPSGLSLTVTALNGYVTFLAKTPLWFIVCAAVGANVAQFMANSRYFAIPRPMEWAIAVLACFLIVLLAVVAIGTGQATLGIGWCLGLFCAAVPILCLARPTSGGSEATNESVNPRAG